MENTITKAMKLIDFHPITQETCDNLQKASGRKFALNMMNEILLDMANKFKEKVFINQNAFISYMSKAFANEKRVEEEKNSV